MEKKEIRELKTLLAKYKHELSKGNKKHAKDAIATLVLLDLRDYPIELMNLEDTTLKTLMFWGPNIDEDVKQSFVDTKSNWFEVPTSEELKTLNNKYKKVFNKYNRTPDGCREKSVTTWLENMVSVGMVKEGDIINLEDYKLTDFITDEKLKSTIKLNEKSIFDYCMPKKTR